MNVARWFVFWEVLRVEGERGELGELGRFLSDCDFDPLGLAWAVGFGIDFHRTCPSA